MCGRQDFSGSESLVEFSAKGFKICAEILFDFLSVGLIYCLSISTEILNNHIDDYNGLDF